MVCLEQLDVTFNSLSALPTCMAACPALRYLDLEECRQLAGLPPQWAAADSAVLPALVQLLVPPALRDDPVLRQLNARGVATVRQGYSGSESGDD